MNVSSINQYSHTLHSNVSRNNREQESITVEYTSVDSYYDHLMLFAMKQASVFAAIKLIHEASELNGGKGLPENYMRKVKMHFINKDRKQNGSDFSNNKMSSQYKENVENKVSLLEKQTPDCLKGNVDNENLKIKVSKTETHFAGIEFHNRQRENIKAAHNEKLRKEMLKGYMQMLSIGL